MYWRILAALALAILANAASAQLPAKGNPLPPIRGVDISGEALDTDALLSAPESPYLLIVLFFKPGTGDDLANKLRSLDEKYGAKIIQCIGIGVDEDEAALKDFAQRLGIRYPLLPSAMLEDVAWLREVTTLPLTLFVQPRPDQRIERIIAGGGTTKANLLTEIAENLFQQRKAEALEIANLALDSGEDAAPARELKGFYLADKGKLDEATVEFDAAASNVGKAAIELERGDMARAAELAQDSADPFAKTLLAEAMLYQGNAKQALETLEGTPPPAKTWQQARTANAQGRAALAGGDAAAAIESYQQAITLDPYNATALVNANAALQQRALPGDLELAQAALEQALALGDDPLVKSMLSQVRGVQQHHADTERMAAISSQVLDLKSKYEAMKASGEMALADTWTTAPVVMALLDGGSGGLVFPRAGTDITIRRALESALAESGQAEVVERDMLDPLLKELNVPAEDLSAGASQRQLGRVLSAGYFAFTNYAFSGTERRLFFRVVDTETTEIAYQGSFPVKPDDPLAVVPLVVQALTRDFISKRPLQGIIAEVEPEILLNIGQRHGVAKGMVFTVLEEGAPVEAAGRVIAVRRRPIARVEVTSAEPDYATCKTKEKREGTALADGMKVTLAPQ